MTAPSRTNVVVSSVRQRPARGADPTLRPALNPAYRKLPPPPARAFEPYSATPFPPARVIGLSGPGAEDVVADTQGRLICGLADGRIVRLDTTSRHEETIGRTGGRPLGLEVLDEDRLLICDAQHGLLRLDARSGVIETLVSAVDGNPLRFCSNVVAAPDGSYWFTESTSRFDLEHHVGAMLEHRPSGRLFRRGPDGAVSVALDALYFPNGLTLVEGGAALIFAETDGYRLTRFEIAGTKAGCRTVIADNLPGFPDNLSSTRDGRFWVAMVGPRNLELDAAGTLPGPLRCAAWSTMPLTASIQGTSWAMAFDTNGTVVADIQAPRPDFFGATGVTQVGDRLYLAGVDCGGLLEVEIA